MGARRRDGYYYDDEYDYDDRRSGRRGPPRRPDYPSHRRRPPARPPPRRAPPPRGYDGRPTRAPGYGGYDRPPARPSDDRERLTRPRPSDPMWDEPEPGKGEGESGEERGDTVEEKGWSKESLAMMAGILYMLMAIYLFFMFFWRDGGRELLMVEFAIVLIVLSVLAIFLSLSHDLRFMPAKVPVHWTNFTAGAITMVMVIVLIKVFKDFSSGPYDIWDDINIVVTVGLGASATYLLLHSMFFERKEPFVQDRVPTAFLSGFAWAGLGGFFYLLFMDEPFDRLGPAPEIFYMGIVLVIIASLAVFFNLLDDTYFAPTWATKKHMNFVSGILLGVILFLVLITALMFNSAPFEVWDTVRVSSVTGIAAFATATGVFSMGL